MTPIQLPQYTQLPQQTMPTIYPITPIQNLASFREVTPLIQWLLLTQWSTFRKCPPHTPTEAMAPSINDPHSAIGPHSTNEHLFTDDSYSTNDHHLSNDPLAHWPLFTQWSPFKNDSSLTTIHQIIYIQEMAPLRQWPHSPVAPSAND